MKRRNRRKMKKAIITVTALLIVLFAAIFIIEGQINNDEKEPVNNEPIIEEPEEEEPVYEEPNGEPVTEEPEPEEPQEPEKPSNEDVTDKPVNDIIIVESPESYDVLVNKKRTLPKTYVPEDLVKLTEVPTVLDNPEINQLREAAYNALKELFNAAKEEEGFELFARSGYRSYGTQESLYNSYVKNRGQAAADKFSAKPGQSEHQTGLSMDITCEAMNYSLDDTFGDTAEGKWVAENAHRFGFIIRYPKGKENITGYMYEPWHLRYLGTDLAKDVYESDLTLEEYFE